MDKTTSLRAKMATSVDAVACVIGCTLPAATQRLHLLMTSMGLPQAEGTIAWPTGRPLSRRSLHGGPGNPFASEYDKPGAFKIEAVDETARAFASYAQGKQKIPLCMGSRCCPYEFHLNDRHYDLDVRSQQ